MEQFIRGVSNLSFLRSIVCQLDPNAITFKVPEDYDYSKTTNDNYDTWGGVESPVFHGVYADIRKTLDYSYHGHYTKGRQLWQDRVIQTVVARTDPQGSPWLVYTCGPMGAGKGSVSLLFALCSLFFLSYLSLSSLSLSLSLSPSLCARVRLRQRDLLCERGDMLAFTRIRKYARSLCLIFRVTIQCALEGSCCRGCRATGTSPSRTLYALTPTTSRR